MVKKTIQQQWDETIAEVRGSDCRALHLIASKMQKCANNPRNGGTGHGDCPYYVDDEDPRRHKADRRDGGMR